MKKIIPFLIGLSLCVHGNAQIISTVAGNGLSGSGGDGGPATAASFLHPSKVVVDAVGNMYISDNMGSVVRKVNTSGEISTFAGTGVFGTSVLSGPATAVPLAKPAGMAFDAAGNLFIADQSMVRKVSTSGYLTTVAGSYSISAITGDGYPATNTAFGTITDVAVDAGGNIYICGNTDMKVRKVNTSGIVSTVAGNGYAGSLGDGGPATDARLNYPRSIALDASGNLLILERMGNYLRKVNTSGVISTIGGTGIYGWTGDGIPATNANFNYPTGLAVDATGNIYIADQQNNRVRMINSSGIITTVAGQGSCGYSGDGGPAVNAFIQKPENIFLDHLGNLYIAAFENYSVRKVTYNHSTETTELKNNVSYTVYPNPVKSTFTISGITPTDKVLVYNVLGEPVNELISCSGNSAEYQTDKLPTGVYIVHIVSSDGKISEQKFIKE